MRTRVPVHVEQLRTKPLDSDNMSLTRKMVNQSKMILQQNCKKFTEISIEETVLFKYDLKFSWNIAKVVSEKPIEGKTSPIRIFRGKYIRRRKICEIQVIAV